MGDQFISETVRVRCRICKKDMLRKNYKPHLKISHPDQNANDLSPHGQPKLMDIFRAQPAAQIQNDEEGLAETAVEQEKVVEVDEVIIDNEKKRNCKWRDRSWR
jgi:hypothetical protein